MPAGTPQPSTHKRPCGGFSAPPSRHFKSPPPPSPLAPLPHTPRPAPRAPPHPAPPYTRSCTFTRKPQSEFCYSRELRAPLVSWRLLSRWLPSHGLWRARMPHLQSAHTPTHAPPPLNPLMLRNPIPPALQLALCTFVEIHLRLPWPPTCRKDCNPPLVFVRGLRSSSAP